MTAMETVQNLLSIIGAERIIQRMTTPGLMEKEDTYKNGELCEAAVAYTLGTPSLVTQTGPRTQSHYQIFPFPIEQWDGTLSRREQLVKAATYLVAAIEKLDREELATKLAVEEYSEPLPSIFTNGGSGTGAASSGRHDKTEFEPIQLSPNNDEAPVKSAPVYHYATGEELETSDSGVIWKAEPKKSSMSSMTHSIAQHCRLQVKKMKRGMRRSSMGLSAFTMGEVRAT